MHERERESLARDFLSPVFKIFSFLKRNRKGTSVSISSLHGSMTVEAAFVLPLFLFFFLNLLSALEMLRLHGNLQVALWETGRQAAVYGYAYELAAGDQEEGFLQSLGAPLLSEFAVRNSLIHYLGEEYLTASPLTGGSRGLTLLESDFLLENDCIDIKVTYEVSPWIKWIGFWPFRMCNRYYGRVWTGYEPTAGNGDQREADDFVYVTEHGTVYHETLDCTYLKRAILAISMGDVEKRRNASGEKYYLCELCGKDGPYGTVYITGEGNRYHFRRDCPSLKRTITTILRTEAQKRYMPCGKCGRT